MREIWVMQPRFDKRVGSSPYGMVDQPRFRAAFDFMRLRADVGEVDELLADWWQEFSTAGDSVRQDLVDQVRAEQQKRPRPARMQRAPRPEGQEPVRPAAPPPGTTPGNDGGMDNAPRKRRRRRRPGGRSSGETPGGAPGNGASGA